MGLCFQTAAVAQPMMLVWGWNYLFDQPMADGGICGETCLNKVIFGAGSVEITHFTHFFADINRYHIIIIFSHTVNPNSTTNL